MAKNLHEIQLPQGRIEGIKIGVPNTWPQSEIHISNPKDIGFDGVRLIGHGKGDTFIELDDWGGSVMIGNDCGRVEIRNCTIVGAKDYGIKCQSARGDWYVRRDEDGEPVRDENGKVIQDYEEHRHENYPDAMLVLRNVRLVTGKHRTKWLVHSTNVDHFWDRVEVDGKDTTEHALYAHGFADRGVYWNAVVVNAIGAEACKCATRPWEAFFAERAMLIMEGCFIRGFGQPSSNWQDGGCVIGQGTGLQGISLNYSVFEGRAGTDGDGVAKETLVSFSNGLSSAQNRENNRRRFYDVISGEEAGDMPEGGAANGHVLIDNCAFLGFGRKKVMQTQSLYKNYEEDFGIAKHNIVRSWKMTNCVGVDGGGPDALALMTLKFVENDQVIIRNCNTESQLAWAEEELGWDIRDEDGNVREIQAHTPVGNGPLSEDRE